ncbi:Helicase ATP-binding domain-containing protein [Durusdinium trenchii]|uniref:Helicase ATP-binding domain-containing protein n=1 Tax=Durusdinium trenchii TaxID=1381693 RepID=A0ABP0J489_9DINO
MVERSSEGIQVQAPVQSHLRDGTPSLMFQVTTEKVQVAQALRNKVLSGALDLALSKEHSAFAQIHVDQSDFLERYEKSLLTLSKLTDHQEQKLQNLKQLGENLHLTAPAGCGKTFVAIQYALDELKLDDRNSSGQMLFVSLQISLGLYFVRWLAVRHSTLTELSIHEAMNLIMKRIVLLQKPYEDLVTLRIEGNKIVQNTKGENVHTPDFLLAVFDECHELVREGFGHLLDQINAKKKLLLSDQSQCSALNLDEKYPEYARESLSEVVRSTERLVRAASAFQIGETQEVSSIGPDGPALKSFIFERTHNSKEEEMNMYCQYTKKTLSHLAKVYPGLRSLHGRLAMLVPGQHFLDKIKDSLQEQLEVGFRHRRFRLVSFEESLSFVPTKFFEGQEELILLDTIDNARGHEHLMVVCIGLDEEVQGKGAEVDLMTRAKLYVGITRAQHLAMVVNKYVTGGWLEFLATLQFKKEEYRSEVGKEEFRNDAAAQALRVGKDAAAQALRDDAANAAALEIRQEDDQLDAAPDLQQEAPEEVEMSSNSVWDPSENEIESKIYQLKFDPIDRVKAGWSRCDFNR